MNENLPDPERVGKEYRKKTTIFAVRIIVPFEVETKEGKLTGKKGDWLAKGIEGELYPIDAKIFNETYEVAF